jgi:N-acetyl sugar amidotransferase
MDTTDDEISFDEQGFCNHCNKYFDLAPKTLHHGTDGKKALETLVNEIKAQGKNKEYDCIIGLSGGVDSTYVAYRVRELGLKPLAVHFDSGWNSELAVKNIENIVKKLDIDLYTHVCDWEEMKDLQLSYFKAGVINADVPMDHAFLVVLNRIARKNKLKFFITGHNFETEGILPSSWVFGANDGRNLKAIQKTYGTMKLKEYPVSTLVEELYNDYFYKLQKIRILNYEPYNKAEVMKFIEKELGWKYYGGKHYESVFTRFYQGHYLVERFGKDKRRAHLSSLICSGQIDRKTALQELKKPAYTNLDLLEEDKEYIPKKLGITMKEFTKIMNEPIKSHYDFPNNHSAKNTLRRIKKIIS